MSCCSINGVVQEPSDEDSQTDSSDYTDSSDDSVRLRNDENHATPCTDEHGAPLDIPNLSREEFSHYVKLERIPKEVFLEELYAGRRTVEFDPIQRPTDNVTIGTRIVLFRVVKNASGSLQVEYDTSASTAMKYIAISHVWGTPQQIVRTRVPGVPWEVDLSTGKRNVLDCLSRRFPSNSWFWMDIFCIDQTPTSPIPISEQLKSIPLIYKSATCVKVLIESPICEEVITAANRFCTDRVTAMTDLAFDSYIFAERQHARKCRSQLFLDPWWDRLWTRQEGLYALQLDFVFLNVVKCPRLDVTIDESEKYITTSKDKLSQKAVRTFINDKWAYHGLPSDDREKDEAYLKLYVERSLDMRRKANAVTGPADAYSPFESAWSSRRITTKARDYVLAVMPDVPGYRVPANARRMSFSELLQDSLNQLKSSCGYKDLVVRIPECLSAAHELGTGMDPALCEAPLNISQAYDAFLPISHDANKARDQVPAEPNPPQLIEIDGDIQHRDVPLTYTEVFEIADSYISTCSYQSILAVPTLSPCTGEPAPNISLGEAMVYRFFRHTLLDKLLSTNKTDTIPELPRPWVEVDVVDDSTLSTPCLSAKTGSDVICVTICQTAFAELLRVFLTCLVCGVTAESARMILVNADLKWVAAPSIFPRPLLAVVKRNTLRPNVQCVMLKRTFSELQGYLIAERVEPKMPWKPVGRTWLPLTGEQEYMSDEMWQYIDQGHFGTWAAGKIKQRQQHADVSCDGPLCRKDPKPTRIIGTRFKCRICYNIDFCASCEILSDLHHDRTHTFMKYKTPVEYVRITTSNKSIETRNVD